MKCEICGKRISKKTFNSNVAGECDTCAQDLKNTMQNALKDGVLVTADAIYYGKTVVQVRQ
ncbi:hypothetical protein [Paenibacillus sp. Leaf72]|uniref:hypothetical protein n=1 Tax=Paenibacillus sp. Leaf72 TaxID=1736234 RepID=UPI0006F2596C|nr:hypothetical protein [Paenibacillus sp. Leaf72]KQN96825.1 hypothetical protein ASF12_22395 [Paenibacillus sp. Leaf72]